MPEAMPRPLIIMLTLAMQGTTITLVTTTMVTTTMGATPMPDVVIAVIQHHILPGSALIITKAIIKIFKEG